MVQKLPPPRPISQDDRDNFLVPVVSGVQELLFAPVNPFNDRPGFVAGPRPQTGIAGIVQDITRLNCRIWASRDKSNYSARTNQYSGEVCGPYLEDLGENPTGGDIGPSFEGGQCPILYNVNGSVTLYDDSCNATTSPVGLIGIYGPIGNVQYDNKGSVGNAPPTCQEALGTRAFIVEGRGFEIDLGGSGGGVKSATITVTPNAGGPDDCGNPPPLLQPPGTVTPVTPIVPNIEIDLPGVGPININVDLNPDGFPVITAPDLGLEVTIAPEIDGDGGSGGGGGGAPPLDPEVAPPIDSNPGGEDNGEDTEFGEPPEGRIWVGAYVQLTGNLTLFGTIPGDAAGQSAIASVVGNASLVVSDAASSDLRSTHAQLRSEWSDHIVPVLGLTVTGIRVRVNPALGYRVYPVSVKDPLAESTENG